ncbi:hypothetical protein THYS13_13520 [Thermoanaerobacter sp. YS13]|uniref:hypothetical protein n=1 Tax=Thermoanaerobacter sp. YS13 TaxID=1511746 RepID=UPI000575AA2C|nr:hypothetical protein [Thermoanaerobacter sp. YS13]KHO63231.1 hypothetical protein THYS13_13520 [Thermoanaerobacter sp. YS13]
MFNLNILTQKTKKFFEDSSELKTILFFTFIFAGLAYFFAYQPSSCVWIDSSRAELGVIPANGSHITIALKTAPVIVDNKLYLPADFVAMASGISEDKIYNDPENSLLIIYDNQHSRIIVIDNKNKKVIISKRDFNLLNEITMKKEPTIKKEYVLLDEMIVKDNVILISDKWAQKLFYVEIHIDGKKITISPR